MHAARLAVLISVVLMGCGAPDDGEVLGGETDAGPGRDFDAGSPLCDDHPCPNDQHCVVEGDAPTCEDNTCEGLDCDATEVCTETPGGGAICEDNRCDEDIDCELGEFCDGDVCEPDVCTAAEARCDGDDFYACSANGEEDVLRFTCSGEAFFVSTCEDDGLGSAGCSCEDDWDCPEHTRCQGKVCVGTGEEPQCLLAPEDFSNALPTVEVQWGGTADNLLAVGSPFESSSQVVQTVAVANLDDDNNDGLVDDRDIPEIIFVSFCGDFQANNGDFKANGVLRAIHGGGPNKGQDFFANCGGVHWQEGDALPATCTCASADLDSTASIAVGDLNYDGSPEIVAITEGAANGSNLGRVRIYGNDGAVISESETHDFRGQNPGAAIHNLDLAGNAEIVVGRHVFGVTDTLAFVNYWQGGGGSGVNGQGPVSCVANFDDTDAALEVLGGTTLYRLPAPPTGITEQSACTGAEVDDAEAWCNGELPEVWDVVGIDNSATSEGFCSVADVWGANRSARPGPNNPLDGAVEAVLISNEPNGSGTGDDESVLQVVDGKTGVVIYREVLDAGRNGGPPNIDDFDGDGFPEVGTASETAYLMLDLQEPTTGGACDAWVALPADDASSVESANTPRQPPAGSCAQDSDCGDLARFACNEQLAECVCLHNSWRRGTEDDSSRVTGSSVFDFNGDGAAEVVYNDECQFRIYDGRNGDVYMSEPSESRTRIEYPVVADVDNDGNAEIVFSTSNESGFCSDQVNAQYNNGIEVWGDQQDFWVSARRIWNQHGYSVTNITEDGVPPLHPPDNWRTYGGRNYNVFRSNPRTLGIAPDLVVAALQFSSPGSSCGTLSENIAITVQIENRGDVRGGQGSVLSLSGLWTAAGLAEPLYADSSMTPLTHTLVESIDPGGQLFVTLPYAIANNSPNAIPDNITATADDPSFNPPNGFERECDENNSLERVVSGGNAAADLRVVLDSPTTQPTCPTVPTTIFNDGSVAVSGVLVRYFAGDPFQGGTPLHDEIFTELLAPGASLSADVSLSTAVGAGVVIHALVDPDGDVPECNDGNNADSSEGEVNCSIID